MEQLHPREIELGLARVRAVAQKLALAQAPFPVCTVGGTNGKGSTVAMLSAMLLAAGYRVGSYSSPHLITYNERVALNGEPVSGEQLCAAFARVEAARAEVELTYFEFGTLAAMVLFADAKVDIAVLEVGLGGRLDAVNLWDAEVAVVTSIGLDHTDWLGPDREHIGREKAGIFRAGKPAICGDPAPPASLAETAAAVGAPFYRIDTDFQITRAPEGWSWHWREQRRGALPYPAMRGDYQLHNAACALMALACLAPRFTVPQAAVRTGLVTTALAGRFQTLPGEPRVVLDVAHNAEAAAALAATLSVQPNAGRTLAVVGMLQDKPIDAVLKTLAPSVHAWYVADLPTPRAASRQILAAAVQRIDAAATVHSFADVASAYAAARADADTADRIVVFGSFFTVSAILRPANRPSK